MTWWLCWPCCPPTMTDLVPVEEAFSGFGHPAVVTVAAVLVVSRALQYSGIVDLLAEWVLRVGERTTLQVLALAALVATATAFMNNVGPLALLMPVAIRVARRGNLPPSRFLMPLAFGSLLGGMVTLIGTPPISSSPASGMKLVPSHFACLISLR